MKKSTIIFLVAATLIFQVAVTGQVYARGGCRENINFYPVCPKVFKCGARGAMQYYDADCRFRYDFGAIGLWRCTEYTLVCGTDPGNIICLGSGKTNRYGQIHIRDCVDVGDLCNMKVALVLSCDVDCCNGCMLDWQPYKYLLGDCDINYVDTSK